MAAYSVLILQELLLLLRALLQASAAAKASITHFCKQVLLAAAWCCYCTRTYHRRQGSDLRSYDALFITVEPCFGRCCGAKTALLAWWLLWRYEDGCQVGLAGENLERELCFFHFIFVALLGRGRRRQRKNEGADSSGCRAAHKIYTALLLVGAFCCLLLLQLADAACLGCCCCCCCCCCCR